MLSVLITSVILSALHRYRQTSTEQAVSDIAVLQKYLMRNNSPRAIKPETVDCLNQSIHLK